MSQAVQGWAEQARYDLDTARALLVSERYLYVLFCCQQAVEKASKAVIVKRTGALPPRIHNLLRLAEAAAIELDADRHRFFGLLSAYYIQSRYPEEAKTKGAMIKRETAVDVLKKTEETTRWLLSMLE